MTTSSSRLRIFSPIAHGGKSNAFSNAKRGFHLTIDSLLNQYGMFSRFRRARFPEKMRLIDAAGMIPSGIMRNLNVERNLLEHEYAIPSPRRVTEAVDVARLLLLATEQLVTATPHEALVGWQSPVRHLLLQLEPQAGELRFFTVTAPGRRKRVNGLPCLGPIHKPFLGHELEDDVKVAKRPWRVIPIDKAHEGQWVPIIRELVNVQRRQTSRQSVIDHEHATVSVSITLPMSLPEGITWHGLLKRTFEDKENKGKQAREEARAQPESRASDLDGEPHEQANGAAVLSDIDGASV